MKEKIENNNFYFKSKNNNDVHVDFTMYHNDDLFNSKQFYFNSIEIDGKKLKEFPTKNQFKIQDINLDDGKNGNIKFGNIQNIEVHPDDKNNHYENIILEGMEKVAHKNGVSYLRSKDTLDADTFIFKDNNYSLNKNNEYIKHLSETTTNNQDNKTASNNETVHFFNIKTSNMANSSQVLQRQLEALQELENFLNHFRNDLDQNISKYNQHFNSIAESGVPQETVAAYEQYHKDPEIRHIAKLIDNINDKDIPYLKRVQQRLEEAIAESRNTSNELS